MESIQFIFGTYNAQAPGTAAADLERVYQRAYKPFLSLLSDFPHLPVVLHYSGVLLEWIEEKHPEFTTLLGEMVQRKQAELLGGGYYDPILTLIPDADKLGQLEKLNTYLRSTFGTRPRGSWLTQRIWEPSLARILKNSGSDYTFLDDSYFHIAGVSKDECFYPHLTEDQGKLLAVFPLCIRLQQMVPVRRPETLIETLKSSADTEGRRVVVLLLPGETLGSEGGSYEALYTKGWMRTFFELLVSNREWLKLLTARMYSRKNAVTGRIYFPSLENKEMMSWVLPREQQKVFRDCAGRMHSFPESEIYLRGGFFRQFLTKYPEVNLLYSRLIYTHILINQLRGDKYAKKAARKELWKGENHAPFWHGRFGGVYQNSLRKSAYRSFIEAERICRSTAQPIRSIIATDFDMDGAPEYLFQGATLNAFVHRCGASLFALDYIPAAWNYLDTMARWPEAYHKRKRDGCDWYPRRGFVDHFFNPDTDLERFDRMEKFERGDFVDQPFELVELKREHKELILKRIGRLRIKKRDYPFSVQKKYVFKESSLSLHVTLKNLSKEKLDIYYGTELNIALAAMDGVRLAGIEKSKDRRNLGPGKTTALSLASIQINDTVNGVTLTLETDKTFDLWSLPVATTQPETNLYQSSCFVPRWEFELAADQEWEVQITLSLRQT